LTDVLVKGGVPAHKIRAILAATGSPSWGIYSGYELAEIERAKAHKEFAHNEKYEFRPRDWSQAPKLGISELLASLNQLRNSQPAFQSIHNLVVHKTSSAQIFAFGRYQSNSAVITIVNLDFAKPQAFWLKLHWKDILQKCPNLSEDFPSNGIAARDWLSGTEYRLNEITEFELDPTKAVALILVLDLN
jgi:starch synthase (maltosyl-transferring)